MPLPPNLAAKSLATSEALARLPRQHWNPLPRLSPRQLSSALESFEYGHLRNFCQIAEIVAQRDETIKSVKDKREKATSARAWEILTMRKGREAEKHREILVGFWNGVRAVNTYDKNEDGGIKRLIRQMMSAVSYRYSVHHLVWEIKNGHLAATFEFVPLRFFENTLGRLRFTPDGTGSTGNELAKDEWMITTGDGLMIAALVAYVAKRYALQDWLAFSEKFAMPGIVGATSAAKGTPEGLAMKAAVEAFGQDWSAVMYGVQDPTTPPIHLIQSNGNPLEMPMPGIVDRVDRRIAALYRGADLSSMSSSFGPGTGATLQENEAEVLLGDDCAMISETFHQVERAVIAWHFGAGTEPLACFKLLPPVRVDAARDLDVIMKLSDKGVRIGTHDAAKRLGIPLAKDGEAALGEL